MNHSTANHSPWRKALLTALLCLACALLGTALTGCQGTAAEPTPTGIVYDDAAVEGGWETLSREEIEETLNQQVEKGYINISMNASPVFENGQAEGNLMIVARFVSY